MKWVVTEVGGQGHTAHGDEASHGEGHALMIFGGRRTTGPSGQAAILVKH